MDNLIKIIAYTVMALICLSHTGVGKYFPKPLYEFLNKNDYELKFLYYVYFVYFYATNSSEH